MTTLPAIACAFFGMIFSGAGGCIIMDIVEKPRKDAASVVVGLTVAFACLSIGLFLDEAVFKILGSAK